MSKSGVFDEKLSVAMLMFSLGGYYSEVVPSATAYTDV